MYELIAMVHGVSYVPKKGTSIRENAFYLDAYEKNQVSF